MSIQIEQREQKLEYVKSIDQANKSIETEQKRLLKEFQKQIKVKKNLRSLS